MPLSFPVSPSSAGGSPLRRAGLYCGAPDALGLRDLEPLAGAAPGFPRYRRGVAAELQRHCACVHSRRGSCR